MANVIKSKPRRKKDRFVKVLIWSTTKEKMVNQLRGRKDENGKPKTLTAFVDDLVNHQCK